MYWPFKTTVKFTGNDGREQLLRYAVSADSSIEAREIIKRRLCGQEVHGYTVEDAVAATNGEAAVLALPDGCVQLLGT
jgi:hypothetical protein